jgi:ubiquinone/menaquinone biosynthesis C-methylase UbiE
MNPEIANGVSQYYTEKVMAHGTTSRGVDWNGQESQWLRFVQLCRVLPAHQPFSILDYGCGYGEMYRYLADQYPNFSYVGCDISEEMLAQARTYLANQPNVQLVNNQRDPLPGADYLVASGILNVKLGFSTSQWEDYIRQTLHEFNRLATKGFAFNLLTSYSDAPYMRDHLYYGNPSYFFDYCKQNFSKYIALLHDYPLYEFTIIVTKPS